MQGTGGQAGGPGRAARLDEAPAAASAPVGVQAADPVEGPPGVAGPGTDRRWLGRAVVGLVHAAIFAPLAIQASYHPDRWPGPDDFTSHIQVAVPYTFQKPWRPGIPHFLWHLCVKLVAAVVPHADNRFGAAVVTTAFAALAGVVWFEVLQMRGPSGWRMGRRAAALLSVALLCMEAPPVLAGWNVLLDPNRIFMPLYAYNNATGLAVRPLAALLVVAVVRSTWAVGRAGRDRAIRALPYVAILTTITRPSLTPPLLLAAPTAAWWTARREGRSLRDVAGPLVRRLVIPCLVVVFLQYLVSAYQLPPGTRQPVHIQPFHVVMFFKAYTPWFWSALFLPGALLATWRSRLWADRYVALSLGCWGVGLIGFLALSPPDPRNTGPDAIWFILTATQMVLLFGARRAIELWRTDRRRGDALGAVVSVALAVAFFCSFWVFTSCQLGGACLTSRAPGTG